MGKDTTGYIERELDADLARWFPATAPVTIAPTVQAIDGFAARLPPRAAAALRALDARVRGGTMPGIFLVDIMEEWTYGFDFIGNGASVVDAKGVNRAADVWSLGCDGSGNYWVLLLDGSVMLWAPTDGDILDPQTRFSDLDTFFWAAVRRAAVLKKRLDHATFLAEADGNSDPGVAAMSS